MFLRYIINVDHRVVFSYGSGALACADCLGHMERLAKDARFHPDFRQIIDFTDTTEVQLTSDDIRLLANRTIFGRASRRAFVASTQLQFGFCRMFATYREFEGEPNIMVFRDMLEAIKWVDVPDDVVAQAYSELRSRNDQIGSELSVPP